jgi:hypothetical protein
MNLYHFIFAIDSKNVFLAVNASWSWHNNVSGVYRYLIRVSRVWDIFPGIGPRFPLAGGLCKFYANAGGKRPIQRQPFLVQYTHQTNLFLIMNNYTLRHLVISRNDKNKQQTLISQRKLALTAINKLFAL